MRAMKLIQLQAMKCVQSLMKQRLTQTVTATGKSMSEAHIFPSTNPQYDSRLFIELLVEYMKIPSIEHGT